MKSGRALCYTIGLALILWGIFMPRGWYDSIPPSAELPPPPMKGIILWQLSFVLEGLALLWFGFRPSHLERLSQAERLPGEINYSAAPSERDLSGTVAGWALGAITLLGLALRCWHLDAALWLDEIAPLVDYGQVSVLHLLTQYSSVNNHLLNTLLVKLCVACFGEREWIVRLPAVFFGVAIIPLVYWLARMMMSRSGSLCAAFLLAVSYPHIFFSQNARGYTAYLFFSLLASGLLARCLRTDRPRNWWGYAGAMLSNFAALLTSAFVFVAHLLVGALAAASVRLHCGNALPLARRLAFVFAITGFLGFQLYAAALPQTYVVMKTTYSLPSAGFASLFSPEFLHDIRRGLATGFSTPLIFAASPFLAVPVAGFVVLFKRNWTLMLALTLPMVLFAIFLFVRHLPVLPRFFLLVLPVFILSLVEGLDVTSRWAARLFGRTETLSTRLAVAAVLFAGLISLVPLRQYYSMPKQDFRAAIHYAAEKRQSGELFTLVYLAEVGGDYYARRFGLSEGSDYFRARSTDALDRIFSAHEKKQMLMVTTFDRALQLDHPELKAQLEKDWVIDRVFPGTIGDGAITVWRPL